MRGKQVYACGPITGLSYASATYTWRRFLFDELKKDGIEVLSPLRGKAFLAEGGEDSIKDSYDNTLLSSADAVFCRDHDDVYTCDLMIAYLIDAQRVSIGSVFELAWAHAYRKPVIAVVEEGWEGNPHDHTFVKKVSHFVVHNVVDAVTVARAILLPTVD